MLHISGYGQSGPYSKRPGMGTLAEAFSGFAHITGEADGPPGVPIADGVASLTGTYAVLAALLGREKNGGAGDEIDLRLYEPLLSLMGAMVIDYDQRGIVVTRRGNRSTWTVPRNAYRTKDDKWVAVSSAANSIAPRMFRAVGRDDLANDPSLATNPQRLERVEDPQVKFRKTLVATEHPVLGKVRMQNVVPRFKRNPGAIRWLGKPEIGADTEHVRQELGYEPAEIE